MQFELLGKEEFITATMGTKRAVAFLIGAPLSQQNGVGVPGVAEVLDLVRAEIHARGIGFAMARFEQAVAGKTGGDAYQEAMKWLGKNAGQDAINDVIRTAVLKARKAGMGAPSDGTDGDPGEWELPSGTASLGQMIAGGHQRFMGPVLTTNFDPLVSLAVKAAGGRSSRRVLDADGTLAGPAEDDPGICGIVHLHGFWRNSDTLHTQAQLTRSRPKLSKSLQRLIQRRTLVVAAYGGWNDVFTQALIELMNDEQAPLDVLWCFYETDAEKVQERYSKLLTPLEPAISMNRFRAFGGIDCHSIFGEILAMVSGTTAVVAAPAAQSPLAGWELVDRAYLQALSPLRPDEVIRYFDGATPTWRHAVCSDIPPRQAVTEVVQRLAAARSANLNCSLQFIRGAGGEGKTTLLLQAAAQASATGDWHVLWRPSSRTAMSPELVAKLPSDRHWLVVADDAENLVTDIAEAARLLHNAGHSHVHFLLAARDTDWRHRDGDLQAWDKMLTKQADVVLGKLQQEDAHALIAAWCKYGEKGLGELAKLPDFDQQVASLLGAVSENSAATQNEGSFFGGLLTVRFGTEGLLNHVITLLKRLKEVQIENSRFTLLDALLYIAACHEGSTPGIDENVLADLLDVERAWIQTLVVNPLGAEAAAVRSAGYVLTRHSKVASAILVAARQHLGIDIAEIWSAIVRQTVHTGVTVKMDRRWYSNIIHAAPRLHRSLRSSFSRSQCMEIAVAAAKSRIAVEPDRLSAIVDLANAYRNGGEFPTAAQLMRDNFASLHSKSDYNADIRGYWFEWGMNEGMKGNTRAHYYAGAWLQGLSLSDHLKRAPIELERVKISCGGLGVAFGKIATAEPGCPFALSRRAAAYLGRLARPDTRTLVNLDSYDFESDKMNTPYPASIEQATQWLTNGVVAAEEGLQDAFLKGLLKNKEVSFAMLREALERAEGHRKQHALDAPLSAAEQQALMTTIQNDFQQKITAGIERVIKQSWGAVPASVAGADRFVAAKKKANEVITCLSPSIRKQVKTHFQSDDWAQLKSADPHA